MRVQFSIDLDFSTRRKRWVMRCAVAAALVLAAVGVAHAAGPVTFTTGEVLQASDLNSLQTQITQAVPVGTITAFAGTIDGNPGDTVDGGTPAHLPPGGWLLCNGDQLNGISPSYAPLYAAIGTNYGGNKTSQAFNLPDLRGEFLRGVDDGARRDVDTAGRAAANAGGNSGDMVGSVQSGEVQSHSHAAVESAHTHPSWATYAGANLASGPFQYAGSNGGFSGDTGAATATVTVSPSGGSETRPTNTYVNYIIKY